MKLRLMAVLGNKPWCNTNCDIACTRIPTFQIELCAITLNIKVDTVIGAFIYKNSERRKGKNMRVVRVSPY